MEIDDPPAVPTGYLRFCYMVGQDQAEIRLRREEQADACIRRSREAIARSRDLLERLRIKEEAQGFACP
jgi:hypothetical protein